MSTTTIERKTTLDDIYNLAHVLSIQRRQLGVQVQELEAKLAALKSEAMPEICKLASGCKDAWEALEAEVRANPQLFVKPRTVPAHGILVGIEKQPGAIEITDVERTLALIKKHLPDQVKALIDVKETPVKKAIGKLTAEQLKKIGATVRDAGDRVVIRPGQSDVDKLVTDFTKAELEDQGVETA